MNLGEWLRLAEARLSAAGIESARMEAQLLAAHILRVDRSWLIAHPEHEFNDLAGEHVLERRESFEPLAYIIGHREFFGRKFGVDRHVLIPRHETETLIEVVLEWMPANEPWTVLDMGTGSGILPITLKLERPEWTLTAVDISAEALAVASANARFHQADVRFVLSDGFHALLGESFDLIVSNPPYIGLDEPLPRDVVEHEPSQALFSGPTGYEFFERLAKEAGEYLNDGGILAMEVGYQQAKSCQVLFEANGWEHVLTRADLSGTDRVVVVRHRWSTQR